MPASSIHSNFSILNSPSPTNLGGNTKMFETTGGKKRRTKKHRKHRKSVKKNKTKRFFFF